MSIKHISFIFILLASLVYSQDYEEYFEDDEYEVYEEYDVCEQEEEEPTVYELDISNAIQIALKQNRQLLGILDALKGSQMCLDFEETAFEVQISPDGQAGYAGGGKIGGGITLGGGLRIAKKFMSGTRISLCPGIQRLRKNYRTNISATVVQPLLRGFGTDYSLSSIRRAQYQYRSARRNYYVAQMGLIVRTVQALYEVVKQGGIVQLNEQSVERLQGFKDAAVLKEKIGLCDSLDVYRAEIELKQAEETLNQSLERQQESMDAVRDLLALPLSAEIIVDVPLEYTPIEVCVEDAINQAFVNRLEVDQADDHIKESSRLVDLAKKNMLPELNLIFDYSNFGSNEYFTSSFIKRESTWGIGFGTSTDWNQFSERYLFSQSLLTLDAAYRNMEQLKQNISIEVKRVLRNLRRGLNRINILQQQIETAEREMELSKIKFEHGMANNFDVIQAEKTLHSAYQSLLSAEIDHVVNEFQLLGVLGTICKKPRIHD